MDQDAELARGAAGVSPFRVVGISTMLIGALMLVVLPGVTGRLAFWMDATIGGALVCVGGAMILFSGRSSGPREESV